jgi:hypothetical protein
VEVNKSESIAKLAEACAKAQAKMVNPKLDRVNPHFKSKFASLAAVRDVVVPAYASCGVSVSQDVTVEGGAVHCRTILVHGESGEWMEYGPLVIATQATAHAIGSAISYAKRYQLMAVACVVGDEDDDGNAASAKPEAAQPDPFTHDPALVGGLKSAKTLPELSKAWNAIPTNVRARYADLKDAEKQRITESEVAHA